MLSRYFGLIARRHHAPARRRHGACRSSLAWTRSREKRRAEERLRYLENYDPLTGFPNRNAFDGLLNTALANMQRKRTHIAVLCVDIGKFKEINDDTDGRRHGVARGGRADQVETSPRRFRGAALDRRIRSCARRYRQSCRSDGLHRPLGRGSPPADPASPTRSTIVHRERRHCVSAERRRQRGHATAARRYRAHSRQEPMAGSACAASSQAWTRRSNGGA